MNECPLIRDLLLSWRLRAFISYFCPECTGHRLILLRFDTHVQKCMAVTFVMLVWPPSRLHPRSAVELDDCHRIGQALSTFLRRRAEEAVVASQGRPVLYSYQCDGPARSKQRKPNICSKGVARVDCNDVCFMTNSLCFPQYSNMT